MSVELWFTTYEIHNFLILFLNFQIAFRFSSIMAIFHVSLENYWTEYKQPYV